MVMSFGMFHPDAGSVNSKVCIDAKNVVPGITGFLPFEQPVGSTSALAAACRGAVSVLLDDSSVATYAGTTTALYKLNTSAGWTDVTRASGGAYACGAGEQWKFALYGTNLIATNIADSLQYIDVTSGTNFAAVTGSPPKARYIDVVRDFVLLGAIFGNEKRVQWSANNDMTGWTAGVNESDYQDFPNGGPVRGVIGGETGYVFQADTVRRMTYVPGGSLGVIFQFDEVEGALGLSAPHSLVKLRTEAYYLARDGFRRFSLSAAQSVPIGVGKWIKWFLADIKPGSELSVLGVANPVRPIIVWAYISKTNTTTTPNRLLIYDWSLEEATYADVSVEALVKWLSPGVTLDTMNSYGTLDTLPFSLDSPFWRGGSSLMGVFGTDHKLGVQSGSPMAISITTTDGEVPARRLLVKGTRPQIDTTQATVAISAREKASDPITFNTAEAMEDTGICPAWASGNYFRARIQTPAGASWTQCQGIDDSDLVAPRGKR